MKQKNPGGDGMGRKKKQIPKYGTVTLNGIEYFRTRIEDADGKRVALYAKTAEELYEKVEEAKRQIEEASFRRATPTVAEYCERWLLMQSAHIRTTTLTDYSSKVKNYIVAPLGHMYMANVTTDDVRLALVAASEKSNSVYRSVHMLYKAIFNSAVDSNIIDYPRFLRSAVAQRQLHIGRAVIKERQAGVGAPVPLDHEMLPGEINKHREAPAEGRSHARGKLQPQAVVLHPPRAGIGDLVFLPVLLLVGQLGRARVVRVAAA